MSFKYSEPAELNARVTFIQGFAKVSEKFYTHNKSVQKIFLPLFFVTPQVATSHIVGGDLLECGDLLLFPRLVLAHHAGHEGSNLGRCSDGLAGIDEE